MTDTPTISRISCTSGGFIEFLPTTDISVGVLHNDKEPVIYSLSYSYDQDTVWRIETLHGDADLIDAAEIPKWLKKIINNPMNRNTYGEKFYDNFQRLGVEYDDVSPEEFIKKYNPEARL